MTVYLWGEAVRPWRIAGLFFLLVSWAQIQSSKFERDPWMDRSYPRFPPAYIIFIDSMVSFSFLRASLLRGSWRTLIILTPTRAMFFKAIFNAGELSFELQK